MPAKSVPKSVAFYKIVDKQGDAVPVIPWQDFLEDLSRLDPSASGHEVNGITHYGRVYPDGGQNYFILAKQRDEPPSTFDLSSGHFIDAGTQAQRPWVELSVIHFISGTNLIALVRSGSGGPMNGSLAGWLNAHNAYPSPVRVVAFRNAELLDKLDGSTVEARLVRFTLAPHQMGVAPEAGGLYSFGKKLGRDLGGDVDVELTVKIHGQARRSEPALLSKIAAYARDIVGKDVSSAAVEIVDLSGDHTKSELIDLTNFAVTHKELVEVTNEDGHPIKIPSAIDALRRAVERMERYLHH